MIPSERTCLPRVLSHIAADQLNDLMPTNSRIFRFLPYPVCQLQHSKHFSPHELFLNMTMKQPNTSMNSPTLVKYRRRPIAMYKIADHDFCSLFLIARLPACASTSTFTITPANPKRPKIILGPLSLAIK